MNIKDYYASSDENHLKECFRMEVFTGIFRTICCIETACLLENLNQLMIIATRNITICSNTHGDSIWDALLVQRF